MNDTDVKAHADSVAWTYALAAISARTALGLALTPHALEEVLLSAQERGNEIRDRYGLPASTEVQAQYDGSRQAFDTWRGVLA